MRPLLIILLAHLLSPCLAAATQPPAASDDLGDALQWRQLGPFRAGWATMAVGVPTQPDTYYFGAAGGGVWKTDDAGATWAPSFSSESASSIGALAVAPSDPRVIYVGSGQVAARYDVAAGDGMYKSTDAGKTWQSIGLQATRHIGAVIVDPTNADHVLVGALGHYYGPNAERGVFRSVDGGKTWQQTLFIDQDTGVVDLAAAPDSPSTLYAAAWQVRNYPWLSYFQPNAGPGSGLFKSTDAGVTWRRVVGGGFPGGSLARIGVATAAGGRVWAVVNPGPPDSKAAKTDATTGGLYRSDDAGATWTQVGHEDWQGSDYFARITADPANRDRLYAAGQSIRRSDDAGKTWRPVRGSPGGDDYHDLWINPLHPERMITASDQGAVVSLNGGRSWSDWYNQPTGQFYHLATDQRFPYWIYSGQQDSGTVAIASRSNYGAPGFRDWHPVGADERDYDLPDPENADIVFGSGLGGRLSRWDARTGQAQNVSPWPEASYGARPSTVKYRYTWFTPIAFSAHAPYELYQGAQVLFRSRDRGDHWDVISPDLSAHKDGTRGCEVDVAAARARDCGYGVIYSIAPSPHRNADIWIGTDDGQVQTTRDGGEHWDNVTPRGLEPWGLVSSVDVSALDADTAYIAIDTHRLDRFAPQAWRTHDHGRSWRRIDAGLPAGQFLSVVRADPLRAGLLYAGSDQGVFVSFDDGDRWQPLQNHLPTAWVRDLAVHGDDLIAATQGRAIWVLDDIAPLRQHTEAAQHAQAFLFTPADAYRLRGSENRDTPPPPETPLGTNPPDGAMIDYRLGADAKSVAIDIRDADGHLVRHFSSDRAPPWRNADRYFTDEWVVEPPRVATTRGMHRWIFDLRHPRPHALGYDYSIGAVHGDDTPLLPLGPLLEPGRYDVALIVDGDTQHATFNVLKDPRVAADADALHEATAFAINIDAELDAAFLANGEMLAVREQIEALEKQDAFAHDADLRRQADRLLTAMRPLVDGDKRASPSIATLSGRLTPIATDVTASDRAPTAAQHALFAETSAPLHDALQRWHALRDGDLQRLDRLLAAAGLAPVVLPDVDRIRLPGAGEARDRP